MDVKEFFEEELSGEPLTQETVEEALTLFGLKLLSNHIEHPQDFDFLGLRNKSKKELIHKLWRLTKQCAQKDDLIAEYRNTIKYLESKINRLENASRISK